MKQKKEINETVKKGLVLCTIGVMSLGMMACGGNAKKANVTQPAVKPQVQSTEANHKIEPATEEQPVTEEVQTTEVAPQGKTTEAAPEGKTTEAAPEAKTTDAAKAGQATGTANTNKTTDSSTTKTINK